MTDLNTYHTHLQHLTERLAEFIALKQDRGPSVSIEDKQATYTRSSEYLVYVTAYHHTADFARFITDLVGQISPYHSIIEVGCSSGFSGLTLTRYGRRNVTFHDFAGLGLEFLGWYGKEEGLPLTTIPYTNPTAVRYDWVLCLDVLEHTGNHLGALRWLEELGDNVALAYPLMEFVPPFQNVMDEWVDDEIIQMTLVKRYTVLETRIADGRRYTTYRIR